MQSAEVKGRDRRNDGLNDDRRTPNIELGRGGSFCAGGIAGYYIMTDEVESGVP
ncbi:MAG: hypothetical protein ACLFWL_10350 [Candidatus Brocadiia bacterium]